MWDNIDIRHPALTVSTREGTEGPKWDPYSYCEVTVKTPKGTLVVHQGLAEWVKLDGKEIHAKHIRPNDLPLLVCDFTRSQLQRISGRRYEARMKALWRECPTRHRNVTSGSGYPGEYITACEDCGAVLDYSFNLGAVE
jgi:hypothetical protein